jgi:GAF domain-containing protein
VTDDTDPQALLHAIALRVEAARRLTPPSGTAVLRSVVDATVALFHAEAASIALHDAATDRLVYAVAAGEQGQGVVGLSIASGEGVAGYVFSTAQPIAVSDVEGDARFGRSTAEQTGYVPRSLVAVPLLDDEGAIGVLTVLDKVGDGGFDLRDIELASVFARQATVAIRSSRIERDTATLLRTVLGKVGDVTAEPVAGGDAGRPTPADADELDRQIDELVGNVAADLDAEDDDPLWALADQIARLRGVDPAQLELVRELLEVVVRRAERSGRTVGRPGFGAGGR